MVVNHQHAGFVRMEDQRRAGDVARAKLLRRKRLSRVNEQMIHQILAFRSHAVIAGVEIPHRLQRRFGGDQAPPAPSAFAARTFFCTSAMYVAASARV